jgi:hypothetical protein
VRRGTRYCGTCGAAVERRAAPPAGTDADGLALTTPRPDRLERPAPQPPPQRAAEVAGDVARSTGNAVLRGIRRIPPRTRLIVVGGLIAVLVLGCGAYQAIDHLLYGPDRPVTELFAALAARDGARVAAVGGCGGGALCRADALRTGYEPPRDAHIVDLTRTGDTDAVARVRYRLAGATYSAEVGLNRRGGLGLRSWRVSALPGNPLEFVSAQPVQVRVAGAAVRTGPGSTLRALPGTYTVTAPQTPLFQQVATTVTSTGDGQRLPVRVTADLRPDVAGKIQDQVDARIAACAQQSTLRPRLADARCPFGYDSAFTFLKDVRWTVRTPPTIAVRVDGSGAVTVTNPGRGQLTLSYAWSTDVLEPRRWTVAEETVPMAEIGGQVSVVDNDVRWSD